MRHRPVWTRYQDWPERLGALVEERRYTSFAWGTHDCAMFAADAVLAVMGQDPLAQWRGAYSTEEEGDAITSAAGGFEAFIAGAFSAFGAMECPPAFAQRGDVGLVQYGNTTSLGVSMGAHVIVPGPDALAFLAPRTMFRAWAI